MEPNPPPPQKKKKRNGKQGTLLVFKPPKKEMRAYSGSYSLKLTPMVTEMFRSGSCLIVAFFMELSEHN